MHAASAILMSKEHPHQYKEKGNGLGEGNDFGSCPLAEILLGGFRFLR